MATARQPKDASIDDLYKSPGKAELVNGELVLMPPTGAIPGHAAIEIVVSLHAHAKRTGDGRAVGDNVGFLVNLPGRQSFCPDAAFWTGEDPGMKFYDGTPMFAVEVRSESDYGSVAERAMADKRADYFAAGTLVAWDVNLLGEDVVSVHRADDPNTPIIYRRGDKAEAEPAVPGWSIAVDDLFVT